MIKLDSEDLNQKDLDEFNDKCEECKKEHESVKQNFIMHSYKVCNSCSLAKKIFPI